METRVTATQALLLAALVAGPAPAAASSPASMPHLRDRGPGIALSQFGTYIEPGEWIIYPFFEYYLDSDAEYSPDEFGFDLDLDFRGEYKASEGLIFLGYGVSDRLAIELEAAIISAELQTAPGDPTAIADTISESGLGDVEGQLRWRWTAETASHPEVFSYFETVVPTQDEGSLIGTTDWEFKLGSGVSRGFSFGSVTARVAVEYDRAESAAELGEAALELVRQISPAWRGYVGVEGTQDEVEGITELQWWISRGVILKLNNAVGLTSKATDWAPEVGLMFRL
jgi:hypothetical protein